MTPLPDDLSEEEKRGFDPRGKAYGVIYRSINRINGKIYVGQTIAGLTYRKASHLWCAKNRKSHFGSAIQSYGEEVFEWEVIDQAYSKQELDQLEIYWIRFYHSNNRAHGYNLEGGGNGKGVVAESTRLKASKSHKARYANGYIHPMTGKTMPQEQIDKMSKTKKRQFETGECVPFRLGLPMSKEQRKKISQTKGGIKPGYPFKGSRSGVPKGCHSSKATEYPAVKIQCVETKIVYESLQEAGRALGISHANFSMYFKGKRKSVAGCQWIKLSK